jgi:predicted Na+-dependent transporter
VLEPPHLTCYTKAVKKRFLISSARLVARGRVANYILFPVLTISLLLLFRAQPLVAVGFMILAVCPARPYGSAYTAIAKGNVDAAAGLMILLGLYLFRLSNAILLRS